MMHLTAFRCDSGSPSSAALTPPLPPLAPPSPRWAMEGDFIWPRVLRSRASMTVCWDSRRRSAVRFFCSGFLSPHLFLPHPSGCAEERRARRIRADTCLSEASLCQTRAGPSTAGCPQRSGGTRTIGSPSLCLLSLGEARESESPAGARPGLVVKARYYKFNRNLCP